MNLADRVEKSFIDLSNRYYMWCSNFFLGEPDC